MSRVPPGSPTPRVSIVIPSWTGEVRRLRKSIDEQTFLDFEVRVVTGVSPAARARNEGAAGSRGDIVVFVDDDAYFGHPQVLERLVAVFDRDPTATVVGASKLLPPSAGRFGRQVALQVPRIVHPVVPNDVESNPPLHRYGFSAITTTCCAVRRSAFEAVGGFDADLPTGGEDPELFYRLRACGGKLVLAGNTWVYHDAPTDVRDLIRKSYWYGLGHSLEARKDPARRMDLLRLDKPVGKIIVALAFMGFPLALFAHIYFEPRRRIEFGFRPWKTLSSYAVLTGYVYGWFHGAPERPVVTYRGVGAGTRSDPEAD